MASWTPRKGFLFSKIYFIESFLFYLLQAGGIHVSIPSARLASVVPLVDANIRIQSTGCLLVEVDANTVKWWSLANFFWYHSFFYNVLVNIIVTDFPLVGIAFAKRI
jgi:hypothetical protein